MRMFSRFKSFFLLFGFIVAITTSATNVSYAADTAEDGITGPLCKVVNLLTGPIGKGIATIAIVFLCFMLFVGKISWGVAIATAIGVAAIPAAPKLVAYVTDGDELNCSDISGR